MNVIISYSILLGCAFGVAAGLFLALSYIKLI
nr:cytochrome b6/f complex subunit VI [Cryptomonas borealis]